MNPIDAAESTHQSYWIKDKSLEERFPKLQGNHQCEIAIIGGGITGLSTAIELQSRGHQVSVLEALTIGGGTTGGSTGHLDAHPDVGPQNLLKALGEEKARAYTRYRLEAIETIRNRATPACDFQYIPAFQYSEDRQKEASLRHEMEAARKIGLNVSWANSIALPFITIGYEIHSMARMHCMEYLNALVEIFTSRGGKIFEHTIVSGPVEKSPERLQAGGGEVEFEQIVCAVHCNYTDALRLYLQTPAYQSYAMAVRVNEQCGDALYWDDHDPYYYIRRAKSDDPHLIIVGGCDHRTGAGDALHAHAKLEEFVRARFTVQEIVQSWSAELFEPTDGLPIIGKVPGKDNVWIATGLSGVGLTTGTAAGTILADQIDGKETELQKEFSPERFGLSAPLEMMKEQTVTAANLLERVTPAERINVNEINPGEGKVGMVDGKFTAVCRDRHGILHLRNPLCVHMQGVLHWNNATETWDCPVHGGRYTHCGERIYGPPEANMVAPDEKAEE